jgi:hypothetical protein
VTFIASGGGDWADRLGSISQRLTSQAWDHLGLKGDSRHVTVFNPLSFTRDILVECAAPAEVTGVKGRLFQARLQGAQRSLVFVAAKVPAFGFRDYAFETKTLRATVPPFSATAIDLHFGWRMAKSRRFQLVAALGHLPHWVFSGSDLG